MQANIPITPTVNSAKWEVGARGKKADLRTEDVDSTCSEPDYASYVQHDGTQRAVKVPQGMSADVEEWLEQAKVHLLDELEEYL